MGADGGIDIARRSDWDAQGFGIEPEAIGLTAQTMVGMPVVFGYTGTNTDGRSYARSFHMGEGWIDDFRNKSVDTYKQGYTPTAEQIKKQRAFKWFEGHSEYYELWT